MGGLAMAARYLLIQPPELAHQCEVTGAPAWCAVRLAIILTYAHYELGYLSLLATVIALWSRTYLAASVALCCGACAIVLYCFEPGAVALVAGALVLARLVENDLTTGATAYQHDARE
jgi:hypothetical protein